MNQQVRDSDRFGISGDERFSVRPNSQQTNQDESESKEVWSKGNATMGPAKDLDSTAKNDISALLGSLRNQMAAIQTDYKKPASRGVCGSCGQDILSDMINARGRVYHVDHFCCSQCGDKLGTDPFYYKDKNSQFCPPCYEKEKDKYLLVN